MRWEAANVKENARPEGGDGLKKSSETVEAAIARLTRAYKAAIKCIGSLHRLESIQEKDGASIQSMQRVADAARSIFERTVLSDPLIAESLAPTWHSVVKRNEHKDEWSFVREARPVPPELTSSSHQSAVRELAYLSLVNYADLLVKASSAQVQGEGILLRGVVSRVPQLSWSEQEEEFMQRLALAALCDASDLDGSDPTVWLKLACAARRLSVIAGESHDRLERHALEQGMTALPSDVPPNRLIVKALEQHYKEKESVTEYPEKLYSPEETPSLVLDLPRYSWSMLGRMLLRACREGSAYRPHFFSTVETAQTPFGSPCIVLKLSPMLTLPSGALGTICQYLDSGSIWKFEATCKALSASILSARVHIERRGQTNHVVENKMDESPLESGADQSQARETGSTTLNNPSAGPATTTIGVVPDLTSNRQTSASTNDSEASRSHRTSKRVQSQRITSGKLAERKAKRNSVEFCFLATLFGCTSGDDKYKAALKEKIGWDDSIPADLRIRPLPSHDVPSPSKSWSKQQLETAGSQARMGSASLTAFVKKWSGRNAGPMDILSRYLAHVAMYVEDVFAVDSDSAVALAPFVIESIDTLSQRGGSQLVGLEPSWYGAREFRANRSVRDAVEVFSVNLLNAELRFRSCERFAFSSCDHSDDGTIVPALVPDLLGKASEIEMAFPDLVEDRVWISLKARLYWLAAGFYFWWSRVSQNIRESREAQSLGLEYIDETIQTLKLPIGNPIRSVKTPQLESQARSGEHWRTLSEDSLASFRDEFQASSVVSIVRERFVEEVGDMEQQRASSDGNEDISLELTENEKMRLVEIGTDLVTRYEIPNEGTNQRLTELIDDFLETCGSDLYLESARDLEEGPWSKIWDLLPSELPVVDRLVLSPNPSILSVLVVCMLAKEPNKLSLLTLLSHLILAGYKHIGIQLQKISDADQAEKTLPDRADDFSDSEDSLASNDAAKNVRCKDNEILLQRYVRLVQFLLSKIQLVFEKNKGDLSSFPGSKECLATVHYSLAFAAEWYRDCQDKAGILDSPLDLHVFLSTLKLVRRLLDFEAERTIKRPLQAIFFTGLSRILSGQRKTFPASLRASADKKIGRAIRQKICLARADYIGLVASEMAYMLSTEQSTLDSGTLVASYLVRDLYIAGEDESPSISRLASVCESVLWFWKYMTVHEPDEICTVRLCSSACTSSFDRPIIERLYAPVSGLVIGLCGSGIGSRNVSLSNVTSAINTDRLFVSEFYDSDSSCTEMVLGATEDDGTVSREKRAQAQLLKGLCLAAHCIALVSVELNAKPATLYKPLTMCDDHHRPLLPLIASRVSNHLADILLTEFGVEQSPSLKRKNLWANEYPVGTRSVGGLIDFTLYKAYRALHGFILTGADALQSIIGMEHLSMSNEDITPSQTFKPESTVATAQLYRCMLRAGGTVGRKSLPKEALECVQSALPAIEENERSRVIRGFLFSGVGEYFLPREIAGLLKTDPDEVEPLHGIPGWVWNAEASPESESHPSEPKNQDMEDAMLVRRGICHELAQGPLPLLSAGDVARNAKSSTSNRDGIVEERVSTGTNEEELSKKFEAVVDDLCYGEPVNSKGWYDASICLLMKADLIADRLGLSKGFSRADDFHIPTNRGSFELKATLADLLATQEQEYERNSQGWAPYLGRDLAVYIRQQWASFDSLRKTFDEIGSGSGYVDALKGERTDEDAYAAHVWQEIGSLYEKGDFVGWQQALGGMFVAALRKMALRCMYVALHLLRRQDGRQSSNGFLAAEIAESLGSLYYSEVMGSQMYGYPMHVMTDHHKRLLIETARTCFQFAIDASGGTALDVDEESRQTWDLLFMKGKCNEKIAATYKKEAFRDRQHEMSDESEPTRAYERHMKQALQDFAASYEEAKAIDSDGGLGEIHGGGSTHGLTEVFYRLHASRFKCLLWAVRQRDADRVMAEAEAVRLTTIHWFQKPTSGLESLDMRERVWAVLVDCVAAFAQCRIDQPFFHRSVYRHAQSLMWAPVFHDPASGMSNGSLGTIPITKGHLLRGLNSTTPCAYSVESIMNALFEKRRPQICAVWVTNTNVGQSPFELLNTPIRKYDSLRGKYISAYIETLCLCNRRGNLENLLQTLGSTPRDLPSLFQSSAMAHGGPPEIQHTKESLLVKGRSLVSLGFLRNLKRKANSALASIILRDLSSEDTKGQQDALKAAYACFLRLNCTVDEILCTRAWKFWQSSFPEVNALCQAYLAREENNKMVQSVSSIWIGEGQKNAVLNAAIEKCQELFPQMSKELYGKRKARSRSKAKVVDSAPKPAEAPPVSGRKRKDPEQAKTFTVSVPEALSAGDKFDTTVQLGDGSNKKIRLTVPSGNPAKLQFSLEAPPAPEDQLPEKNKE